MVYTHEVWLMLIGLNLDIWICELVDKVVGQFGKLMVWEEDHNQLAHALIKARVVGLDAIPWFFNFSEGKDPVSNGWTVQCEIINTRMLGAQPQYEDFPPNDRNDIDPNHFDFFGFGQSGRGPNDPHLHQMVRMAKMFNLVTTTQWPRLHGKIKMCPLFN